LDVSVRDHKGLGRYLNSLIKSLNYLNLPFSEFGSTASPFSIRAFFRKVPYNGSIYIFPHINIPISSLIIKSKILIVIHDTIPFENRKLQYLIWRIYLIFLLQKKNVRVITPSSYSKSLASKMFYIDSHNISVLYNQYSESLTLNRECTRTILNGFNFIFVGNNLPHKNLDILLSAFKLVYNKNPAVRLHLVLGRSPQQSTALHIDERVKAAVTIYSSLSDKQLFSLLASCDVLIQPSLVEGFGIPILEALALRVPVIASNIPVFRELFDDSIKYFDPHSAHELSKLMLSLSYDSQLSHPNPTPILEKFSISSTSSQLDNILRS